jgi:hypothetical protein
MCRVLPFRMRVMIRSLNAVAVSEERSSTGCSIWNRKSSSCAWKAGIVAEIISRDCRYFVRVFRIACATSAATPHSASKSPRSISFGAPRYLYSAWRPAMRHPPRHRQENASLTIIQSFERLYEQHQFAVLSSGSAPLVLPFLVVRRFGTFMGRHL